MNPAPAVNNIPELISYLLVGITLPKSTISGFVAGLLAPVAEGGLGLISTIKDIIDPDEAGYMYTDGSMDTRHSGLVTPRSS
jgi:hypothetical protein